MDINDYKMYLQRMANTQFGTPGDETFWAAHEQVQAKNAQTIEEAKAIIASLSADTPGQQLAIQEMVGKEELSARERANKYGKTIKEILWGKW
jgi:hypothetical protein